MDFFGGMGGWSGREAKKIPNHFPGGKENSVCEEIGTTFDRAARPGNIGMLGMGEEGNSGVTVPLGARERSHSGGPSLSPQNGRDPLPLREVGPGHDGVFGP